MLDFFTYSTSQGRRRGSAPTVELAPIGGRRGHARRAGEPRTRSRGRRGGSALAGSRQARTWPWRRILPAAGGLKTAVAGCGAGGVLPAWRDGLRRGLGSREARAGDREEDGSRDGELGLERSRGHK
jgi:hypothetical protein